METQIKTRIQVFFGPKVRFILHEVIVYSFLLLFVYTATDKLYNFKDFNNVLSLIPLIGKYHAVTAPLIIVAELLIAVMLIIPSLKPMGMHATLVLMLVFTICLIFMVSYAKVLPCSCGGITARLSWKSHIWLNLFLIILAGSGILTHQYIKSTS